MRHGRIPHAYLGVGTQPIRIAERERGESRRTALMVVDVDEASPAAGVLLVGDIILTIDGEAIADPVELRSMLRSERIGQRVRMSVIRAGQRLDVDVTVGERPPRPR
jgi:S1-C subfamily serine protease